MKKRMKISLVVIIVAVISGSIGYWAYTEMPKDSIKWGHLTWFSGPYAPLGPSVRSVVELVADEVNDNPPLGREVEYFWGDTECTEEGGMRESRRLIDVTGVDILSGHGDIDYYATRDFLLTRNVFYITAWGGGITHEWGGTPQEPLFSSQPPDAYIGIAEVAIMKKIGCESAVVVTDTAEAHIVTVDMLLASAEKAGLNILDEIRVEPGRTSFRDVIDKAMGMNPDFIVLILSPMDGGLFLKQAYEMGYTDMKYAGDTELGMEEVIDIAGHGTDHLYVPSMMAAGPGYDAYSKAWDESPITADVEKNIYTALSWDIYNATFLAIEKAGSSDAGEIAKYIREVTDPPGVVVYTYTEGITELRKGNEINYEGASGGMHFDEFGDAIGTWVIMEVQNLELTVFHEFTEDELTQYIP